MTWFAANRHVVALLLVSLVVLAAALASPGHALMLAIGMAGGVILWRYLRSDSEKRAEISVPVPRGEDSLGAVLDALPQPIVLVGRRGNVALLNLAARTAYPGLAVGAPLAFAVRAPQLIDAVNATLQDGVSRSIEIIDRVPVERAFIATVAALSEGNGLAAGIIFRETSKERAVENMRADFVANASHELRTPLATIIGFVETLRGAARDDAAARDKFLGIVHVQAKRMARLIDDLLSLSRIELKEHIAPTAPVDLAAVVKDVSFALSELARDNGVELGVSITATSTIVAGDQDELSSVVENLIENAIKYGKAGKRVDIELADEPADHVRLMVKDFGPGIAPEALPRLTERFYRVDSVLSRSEGGTGLGLALVKHTVNRHRGRLQIESTLGQGTSVSVMLRKIPTLKVS